jgi:hypothetical protein
VEKELHILSVFVALVILHALRVLRVVMCSLPVPQYFSTLLHKLQFFGGKNGTEHSVSFDFVYN